MQDDERSEYRTDPVSLATPVYRVEIPITALVGLGVLVVVLVLLLAAIDRAQQLVGLVGLAAVLAAVVSPVVARSRRGVGEIAATVIAHLVILAVLAAGTGIVIQSIRSEAAALEEYADQEIESLEDEGPAWLGRVDLSRRVGEGAASWGTVAVVGEDEAAGIATRLSQLVIIVVLSVFLSLQSGRLLDMAMGWTSDRERRRLLREVWGHSVSVAASYLRRTILVALVSGAAAAAVAAAFGLPGVLLIGAWAGFLSMIPLLGALVGWAPIVVLGFIRLSPGLALAVMVLAIVGAVATTYGRSKLVGLIDGTIGPGSLIVAVGIATGLSAAGLPGAAAGIFLAVAAATAATHNWSEIRDPVSPDEHSVRSSDEELANEPDAVRPTPVQLDATNRLLLQPSRQTAIRIAGLVVVAFMVQLSVVRMGPTAVYAIVGLLIAAGLDRPVNWLTIRCGARRSTVVIVGAILLVSAVGGLVATAQGSFGNIADFGNDVPQLVESIEALPLIGDNLAESDLQSRIEGLERDAPRFLNRSPMAGRAVGVLGGGLIGLFWVAVIALAALLDGPRLVGAIDRRVPARFRRQSTRLARAAHTAIAGYVAGSATVAGLNGVIIGTIALIIGAPIPAILALWAFSWNFIPQVGAIIGWTPLIVLAIAGGPVTGVAVLVVFVLYQALENNLIQPAIVGHAVDISALAAFGAALVGAAIAGLIGAVLAIPFVGVVWSVRNEMRGEDFPSVRLGAVI